MDGILCFLHRPAHYMTASLNRNHGEESAAEPLPASCQRVQAERCMDGAIGIYPVML